MALTDEEQLALDNIEARYLGKPMPTPLPKRPETIEARQHEAAKQLYLAAQTDDPRVAAVARAQFARAQVAQIGTGEGGIGRRTVLDVGRNEPCPCGSGDKFKHCCST